MPNINTTYFLSNAIRKDSLYLFDQPEIDTFEICAPVSHLFPYVPLKSNSNIFENLGFTIFFFIIFAFVRLRGKDLFNNLLSILIKRKKVEVLLTEGISSNLICYLLSLCLSFSVISACIVFVGYQSFFNIYSLYIFSGLLLYHFVGLIIVRLLGWAFKARNTADEVIVNLWTFHILMGLLIAPFVFSIFFVREFAVIPLLKIVIFGSVLLILVKFIRWVEILFAHRVSILYMILYLCVLEIIPLLIVYKVVA
ncbi:MAG: DUF4271 domain-containing protein [Odoribacter sp.]